jgi:hypothetical protein
MSILKNLAVLSLLGLATANIFDLHNKMPSSEVRRGRFGAMEIIDWNEEGFNKIVLKP